MLIDNPAFSTICYAAAQRGSLCLDADITFVGENSSSLHGAPVMCHASVEM